MLLPIAGLSLWARNQLLNTDRYVDTVTPLATDPAIQAAVADRVSDAVSNAVDLQARAEVALPDNAKFLAAPIAAAGQNLIHQVATQVITSDQFRQLWITINREAHSQVVDLLEGKNTSAVQRESGQVVLQLGPIAQRVLQQLDQVVPVDLSNVSAERLNAQIVLIDSSDLARVQSGVDWFNRLTWLLIVLTIAAFVASVLVADDRRRGVQRAGLAITISMAVMLVLYSVGRSLYISNLPSSVRNPDAAKDLFDIVTRYVQRGIRTLLVIGLVLFVVAWLVGPSRSAVRVRGWWERIRAKGSAELGSTGAGSASSWLAPHANEVRFAIVGVAVAALVVWDQPTGKVVVFITLITAIAIGVVSIVAGAAPVAKDPS
ncbi:MAG TPA: hypothetical protein VGJ03_13060 [Acidimicrobiales bacterium]